MPGQPYQDRHVVVTGGTGALGIAVVGALLEAGATCHVPYFVEAEAARFPHREHKRVSLINGGDLADEAVVARVYGGVARLWASIHIAGGFAYSPIGDTTVATLRRQVDMNFVSCFLCCRAAVATMAQSAEGGRIVNVTARPALEGRAGANMTAYAAAKAAVATLTIALAAVLVVDQVEHSPALLGVLAALPLIPFFSLHTLASDPELSPQARREELATMANGVWLGPAIAIAFIVGFWRWLAMLAGAVDGARYLAVGVPSLIVGWGLCIAAIWASERLLHRRASQAA